MAVDHRTADRGRDRLRLRDVRAIWILAIGTVMGHSGGYPGFGSHMRWHPASRLGVVVLGNRTYFPALKVGEQMLSALVRAPAAPVRRLTTAPTLEAARDVIEGLLASWDDDLAAATFSMNVDMDVPMARRRAAIERLRETHGALRRSDEAPISDTPLHAAWWLEGEPGRGRVKVEITLDPQPVPKVQWLELTSVPEPDPRWRGAADALDRVDERRDDRGPVGRGDSIAPWWNATSSWCGRSSDRSGWALRSRRPPRA